MLIRLKDAGSINSTSLKETNADTPAMVEREAVLVYEGKFLAKGNDDNPDGIEVIVTEEDIKRVVKNHNSVLARVKRMFAETMGLNYCPPIMIDHGTSAMEIVGRLVGKVRIGEHTLLSGKKVVAIIGTIRFLGSASVERVNDGRWIHLSMGVDFEAGRIEEVSVVPFAAAREARLLSASKDDRILELREEALFQARMNRLSALKRDIRISTLKGHIRSESHKKVVRLSAVNALRASIVIEQEKIKRLSALREEIRNKFKA